ncbi:hypothetical protein PTTG_28646 [Puccinia triticina 1-1 BBBD Race 1]|uniref:GAF domain-containing protein n=1 Tax=Puccinia triticina (isolate 1-1 / race 1 (BBBD)) TaxID=630390 RepID=A0A180GA83_PUCT1|nr:hypothetical protein PTTG_28646 [Puccinia triticina 1-1 BBBD Race 1]
MNMAHIAAGSCGINLPHSSLFNVNLRDKSTRQVKSRPPDYFWKKATSPTVSDARSLGEPCLEADNWWLDLCVRTPSDDDEEAAHKNTPVRPKKSLRFTQLRRIAFKAFAPKSNNTNRQKSIVTSTEVIFREGKVEDVGQRGSMKSKGTSKRITIFKSLKFKRRGSAQPRAKKMVAILKNRISADSPREEQPKTWDEYSRLYANEQIDIGNPPVPMLEGDDGRRAPSVLEARYFAAPNPANESVRQLVLNRLGIFGGKPYDGTDEGFIRWKDRVDIGSKLMEEGKAPSSLESPWLNHCNSFMNDLAISTTDKIATESDIKFDRPPFETLEQHPVLRKIVNQCRELCGVAYSLLSVFDDDRLIILAESGLADAGIGGVRDAPRELTFCSHTILGDRKGLTILDARKDWRFENNPSVQSLNTLFYSGVPLISPNLDGSQEAEENSYPIGSLCVGDFEPREDFSAENRRRLVYMAEYARREIERWFARKMEQKRDQLRASEESWNKEVKRALGPTTDRQDSLSLTPHPFPDAPTGGRRTTPSSNQSSFRRLRGLNSIFTPTTSPSLHTKVPSQTAAQPRAGLFEDIDAVLNPQVRKVMDLATQLIGETLDLSLVYLTAVLPPRKSDESGRTMIISGHNIPIPVPVFDAGLHLRALREPDGSLLYQNPSSSEKTVLQPKSSSPTVKEQRPNPYASAMIFAVGTEAYNDSGGFVLAGYTDDPKRVFGSEDASFMKKFADELSSHTSKLPLSNSTSD